MQSLRSIWPLGLDEWQCAAVDAVCAGLVAAGGTRLQSTAPAGNVEVAAGRLGEQRAQVGADLTEARTDLAVALRLSRTGRRLAGCSVEALTVGWANAQMFGAAGYPLFDAALDAATPAYLAARLGELYREADVTRADVTDDYLLVVAETDHAPDPLVAERRSAVLQSAMRYAFVGGESIVAASDSRAIALAARSEPRLSDSLARLRSELWIALDERRLPQVRSWRHILPRQYSELAESLGMLLG